MDLEQYYFGNNINKFIIYINFIFIECTDTVTDVTAMVVVHMADMVVGHTVVGHMVTQVIMVPPTVHTLIIDNLIKFK